MPPLLSKFSSGVYVGDEGRADISGVRSLATNYPKEFFQRTRDLVAKGELSWERVRDLRGLYEALKGIQIEHDVEDVVGRRTIMSSAFPLLSGELTIAGIQAAYATVPTISQELCVDFQDPKRFTHIAGIRVSAHQDFDDGREQTPELDKFPEIGASDTRWVINSNRAGYMVKISQEMISENNLADIIERINYTGKLLGRLNEERAIRKVYDFWGSRASPIAPYVLQPNGVGAALYTTSTTAFGDAPSGTQVNSNALVDTTDLEAARTVLVNMRDPVHTSARLLLPWNEMVLIVPDALISTAEKILKSEMEPGIINEHNLWGTKGRYRPRVISSPIIDGFSTTCWLMGFPKMIFRRKIKQQMQNYTLGMEGQLFLERGVAFQARVSSDVEVGAVGNTHMVRNLAATTAPGD